MTSNIDLVFDLIKMAWVGLPYIERLKYSGRKKTCHKTEKVIDSLLDLKAQLLSGQKRFLHVSPS